MPCIDVFCPEVVQVVNCHSFAPIIQNAPLLVGEERFVQPYSYLVYSLIKEMVSR